MPSTKTQLSKEMEACSIGRDLVTLGHLLIKTAQDQSGITAAANMSAALTSRLIELSDEPSQDE